MVIGMLPLEDGNDRRPFKTRMSITQNGPLSNDWLRILEYFIKMGRFDRKRQRFREDSVLHGHISADI
jgi:hypothetical protein